MFLLLACTGTPTPATPPLAEAPEAPRRYSADDITAVIPEHHNGTASPGFARDADVPDSPWQAVSPDVILPDGITPEGAEYPVEFAEYITILPALTSGEVLVESGVAMQGDGEYAELHLFSPAGRLLWFSAERIEGGSSCGEVFETVTIAYPHDASADRDHSYVLSADPVDEPGCEEAIRLRDTATDPGWGPRWLLLDELPVPRG